MALIVSVKSPASAIQEGLRMLSWAGRTGLGNPVHSYMPVEPYFYSAYHLVGPSL